MLILAIALTATVRLAVPPITVACSCAMLEAPMRAVAGDVSVSVFTGVAGPSQAAGVPIRLTRWFQGAAPPSGVAVLDPAGFLDPMGGSCGTAAPTESTEWIFATGRNEVGRYVVHLCTTHAPLDSDLGRELLAEAQAVFGAPALPVAPTTDPPDEGTVLATVVPILLGGLFAVGLVGGLFGILGRRGRDTD
jgi:hypothetical protein